MRGGNGSLNIFTGAGAWVDEITGAQLFQNFTVYIGALALIIRSERAANVRPLAPREAKPAQVFKHGLDKFRLTAGFIQIFVAQDHGAAMRTSTLLGSPKRAGMTEVHVTRGRRRETSAIAV